ncbi:efflux RND transporter permease subunit [Roseiconus lacunae]|uniref:Efflux RND transporter permease subunit n=1 Tax=Roseiconus lacunae TaxID=2605694 RepID=A0ABT7PDQ0_9BACT|nr:efflux RND transporter permease subunit [Roseiconus lacunae]MDM4014468.1 efflux RND transporter permease subunit [Roseiconus lacunae]
MSRSGRPGRITTLFYRHPRALMLVIGLVVVAGLTSYAILPRMEDPVIGQRAALISTRMPGADAKRVEVLLTEPIEDRLQEVEEIKKITSESRPGISTIQIELREEVIETDEVWSEVRSKVNDVLPALPVESQRPVFDELKVRAYAMIIEVCWERPEPPPWSVLRRYAKHLEDGLQAVKGTEIVDRFADPGEQITIELDPDLVADLGLDARDVAVALGQFDAKNAAGVLRTGDQNVVLEMANQFEQSDRIGETMVRVGADGELIRLSDLATITRGVPSPLSRMAKVDGKPAVSLGVMVRPLERLDIWRPKAEQVIAAFQQELPAGIGVSISLDQSRYVSARLGSLTTNLVIGVIAVMAVVFFLMGWRSAIVVAAALPLSMLTVLFGLRVLEIPIHQMSVTGLIIALGLLIDNAIVAVDEVTAAIKSGKSRIRAVGEMVRHLALPLTGSTVTTMLAFAPLAMMPGNAGEFVGSIAVSVILAITASLFFALTIIPVFAARFAAFSVGESTQPVGTLRGWVRYGFTSRRMAHRYRQVLDWLLTKPTRALLVSLVLPVIGFYVATRLPEQFFPPADRDQFHIQLELPVDASLAATERAADRLSELLRQAGALHVSWYFGESAPTFYYNVIGNRRGVPNFANAIVRMESIEGMREVLQTLQARADRLLPEARVLVRQLEQGPPFDAPIEIRLFGPDLERLAELGDEVRLALARAPDVIHTKAQLNETLATVSFDVRQTEARLAGLGPEGISRQLFGLLEGVEAGSVLEDTERIPVVVRVREQDRSRLQAIHSLQLGTTGGERIPIESVVDVSLANEVAVIPRMNRRRMNLISGFLRAGTLPSVSLERFQDNLKQVGFELPAGYSIEYGGEASQRNDAVGQLMANTGVLIVLMVASLVLSFGSFRYAATILAVAVFSCGLGMIGLWGGGYPFGFMAIIGIMGLVGVAINDSIVVLAALQQASQEGWLTVGKTVDVVIHCTRHVVATTLTTIAGFMPLIVDGGEFWPPLAIAIAGGVSGATLLALCFVPAVFQLVEAQKQRQGMTKRLVADDSRPLGSALAS